MIPGEEIKFQYKDKECKGVVNSVTGKHVNIKLTKGYNGKNEYWGVGEVKTFSIKNMQDINVIRTVIGFKINKDAI